jgi:hypothetical protein
MMHPPFQSETTILQVETAVAQQNEQSRPPAPARGLLYEAAEPSTMSNESSRGDTPCTIY